MISKLNIVVIGNGMVGYKFCEKLVAKGIHQTSHIIVFGEEPRPAYDRVHLTSYISGTPMDELYMAPFNWYEENKIQLYCNDPVVNLNVDNQTIETLKGQKIRYDKLIFATGSAPFVPKIPGVDSKGVFVYRTIEDLDAIIDFAKQSKRAAVIGGGLLGLEAANALLDLGQTSYVVEFAPRLMPRQLDDNASKILQNKLEALGLTMLLNKNTLEIKEGAEGVDRMVFTDESELEVDMIVVSAGIKPRDEVASKAGIAVGPRGGIVVNNLMETSAPNVYAIGEVALHGGMIYGLVAPGYDMAETVASNIAGKQKEFLGFDMSTKLKLIGVEVASFGDPFCEKTPHDTVIFENKTKGVYKRVNISKDHTKLLGGILVGDAKQYNMLLQTTLNGLKLPKDIEDLIIEGKAGAAGAESGLASLPDTALICSCESVSKGTICGAVKANPTIDFAQIKFDTKAGTGCGGCVPMVKDLMSETLKGLGLTVKKTLCEHFQYSRQELYDLIKVQKIKTYTGLLAAYGKGRGCEVCKPAAASMFASAWNEQILEQDTIQDSNDRFLANIQKGGTYSVIPRIPGGEITPDKLVVIGQVAQKYNLYCKITGGQRIDLFGASMNDLPAIWEELIKAGFESGHAYAKSLRTVKSCVGSTWCRFGVQDSVKMAIDIENRYKGLRAPHKIKMAVSGCIRECAEAQSKDVGIIATEKGWNMYICGNGGSKPQHAVLFATDLSATDLIKYIDRLMMFYVRTADPLTRTATWLNKLDGGIDYLREVILEDSLGIGAELEAEMDYQVATYQCEWKHAVETPEIRKKFKHFINTPQKDMTLSFKTERGQIFPTNWTENVKVAMPEAK